MLLPDKRKRPSDSEETQTLPGKRLKPSGSTGSQAILHNQRPSQYNRPIRRSQSESSIQTLPLYKWNEISPDIQRVYLETPERLIVEMKRLIKSLDKDKIVAFDMEWPWDRKTQVKGRVALIQIASRSRVVIYGVPLDPKSLLPHPIISLLQRADVIKVGNNIAGDMKKLHNDYTGLPKFRSLLDLSTVTVNAHKACWSTYPYPFIALHKLVAKYLNKQLVGKDDIRFSNWQLRGDQMTQAQLDYASADVTVSLLLLDKLRRIGKLDREKLASLTFVHDIGKQTEAGTSSIRDSQSSRNPSTNADKPPPS